MSEGNPARLRAPVAGLLRRMARVGPAFRGSVARVWLTCGKPNCRCARGERHEALYASYRFEGKTRVVHVPRAKVAEAARAAANWRRLRGLLEQLAEALAQEWKEAAHGRADETEGSSGGAAGRAGGPEGTSRGRRRRARRRWAGRCQG
jgi:hypothetical protein